MHQLPEDFLFAHEYYKNLPYKNISCFSCTAIIAAKLAVSHPRTEQSQKIRI